MKILDIKTLAIPEIKVIRFAKFSDYRGFFTESYRFNDFEKIEFLQGTHFTQCNESYSKQDVIRGLHFQWNPYMGKLVRTVLGRMVDLVLDIRKGSSTFGKIIAYDMPANPNMDYSDWIWVPPGFAHGNFFTSETYIQYFCTGQYNPSSEAGISPFSKDIEWDLCAEDLKMLFDQIKTSGALMTEKDKNGLSLKSWMENTSSSEFIV